MSTNRRSLVRSTLERIRGLFERRQQGRREMRRLIGTHFEWLEPRAMLTGNPSFSTIANQNVLGGAPTWLGLTGVDPNGGPLTYTVSVTNSSLLQAIVPTGNKSLVLSTSGAESGVTGQMTFQLFDNLAPRTTSHIEQIVSDGEFATNSTFYRIAASGSSPFVIQGGPSATQSSLKAMDDEFNADLQFTSPGLLAMAKSSDDTGDSQIFVTAGPTRFLDFQHSIFGIITAGDSVRQAIQSNVPASGDGQPPSPITISGAQIITDTVNGALELKAAAGASGSSDVTVTVTDTTGAHFSQTFHVTVTPDSNNPAPFLSSITPAQQLSLGNAASGVVGQPITLQLAATDVQHKDTDFFDANIAAGQPGGYTATVNHTTGAVTLTPPAGSTFTGSFDVTVSVKGNNTRSTADQFDTEKVTVTVKPTTPSVDLVDASDTGVSHTDNITNAASLDFSVTNVAAGATVKLMKGQTQLASGTVAAGATSITLTVPNAASVLGQGVSGITAIQTVSSVDSAASSVLNVTYDSTAPTFSSTAPTSALATFGLTYDAQTNEEGATSGLVYTLTGAPTGAGAPTINSSTGVLTWTPTTGQVGTQTFSIVATDSAGNSTPQPLTVAVASPVVDFTLKLTNPDGTPVTSLSVGQNFVLHVLTQDVRADVHGVFAAFTDVTWDGSKAVVSLTTPEVQQLAFIPGITSGNFKLSLTPPGGSTVTTAAIDFSTDKATLISNIQTALNTALGAGTVTVAAANATTTTLFKVTFNNTVGTAGVPLLVLANDGLTGGNIGPTNPRIGISLVAGDLQFSSTYGGAHSGDPALTPGAINEAGGIAGVSETGADQLEVFSVPMKATAAGTLTFATAPAQDTTNHGVLVYGATTDNVPNSQIHFGSASIDVGSTFNAVNDTATVSEDSSNNTINPLANDTSVGSNTNTLTITAVGATNHGGTVTISADGKSLKYTPAALFTGTETFTYAAKNQNNETHTATVTMTVTGVNHAPTATNDTLNVAKSSTSNTLDVLGNDTTTPDTGETLRVSAVTNPSHGTVTIGANGANVIYTPTAGFTGTDTFTYTINDRAAGTSGGLTSTATVTVKVGGLTATSDNFTVSKGASATTLDVLANDLLDASVGGTLTISAVGTPDHGGTVSISSDSKTLSYTPASSFQGTEKFTYTVSDGHGNASTATVSMAVNGPPTANNDGTSTSNLLTVFQGTNTLDVLANDVSGTTPAGTLTIDSASLTQPAHGTVSVSTDGKKIIYTPTASFTGTDSFTYKAKGSDGQLSQAATASFTVQPFVASTLAGFVYFDVNNNGTKDANELPIVGITITLTGTPTAGDTTAVNRTAKTGDDGSYSFGSIAPGSYTLTETQPMFVIDGKVTAGSAGGTAGANKISSITINSTATGTAGAGNNFGERGRDVHTISLRDYFSSNSRNYAQTAFDGSGNELWHTLNGDVWTGYTNNAFSLITNKTTIQLQATNTQSQTVTATLATGDLPVYLDGSSSGNVLYHVPGSPVISGFTSSPGPTNQAPTANADTYFTPTGAALTTTATNGVLKNDTDPNTNTTLKATIATQPSHGTVTLNNDGTFTYTPTSGFSGTDTFTYKASDGTLSSNTATVTINVGVTANADSYVATENQALTIQGSASNGLLKNDAGGAAALQVVTSSVTQPTHGTVTVAADGTFTYTPTANYNGSDAFTYKATDGTNQSGVATVTITVAAVNSSPVAANDTLSATKNTPITVPTPGVLGNDHDPDDADSTLTVAASSTGSRTTAHGTVVMNANGSYTYTPATDYLGDDSFSYTVTDPHGGTADATVTIHVLPPGPVGNADTYTTDAGTALTIDAAHGVLANDTAADIAQVSAINASQPANGSVTLNTDGSFTYTPSNSTFTGPDTFTYQAHDSNGDSVATTVTINVNALPVANDDSFTASPGTPLVIHQADLLGNDTFVTTGTHTAVKTSDPTHGALTQNGDGSFTYTPSPTFSGNDSFTYQANDGIAASATSATITITVNNHPPVLDQIDDQTIDEHVALTFQAHATDPDQGQTLMYSVSGAPIGVSISTGGAFSWTPTEAQGPGTYTFDVIVTDGLLSDSQTVHVTVNEVNAAPSGADKTLMIGENSSFTFAAADFGFSDANDAPANTLSAVKIDTLPAAGSLLLDGAAVTAGQEITAADLAAGKLVFTPASGEHATPYANFTFQVRDNGGTAHSGVDLSSAANTVTIDVAADQAPVVQNDAYTTAEDTTLTVDEATGVLSNDSDPENDLMHALIVAPAQHGSVTLNSDGSFTYVPAANYHGPDQFTYQANDGTLASNTATVAITVTSVNDAPVGVADSYDVAENGSLEITTLTDSVLHNDTDVDGDLLTAHIGSPPLNGQVILNANGTFTYTPNTGFSGDDTFTYKPFDGTVEGNDTVVSITVHAPPTVHDDSYTTDEDTPLSVTEVNTGVLANDTTSGGHAIADVTIVDQAQNGHVDMNADGTFTYTPNQNFNGTDTFTYTATDGVATSDKATVTVTVNAVNDAPVAANDSYVATQDTALSVPTATGVLANDHDVDNAILSIVGNTQPANGQVTLNPDGSFDYTPSSGFTGTDTFDYTISDGQLTSHATVTIDVQASGEGEAIDAALLSLMNPTSNPTSSSSYAAAVDYLMATLG